MDFPLVLLDEAAQCNEANSLIPMKRGCEQAILIGDHKQLQSTCEVSGRAVRACWLTRP
jgi:superfamily I DNA and/or RNA helicase